jgi:hypothetical protein
LAALSLLLDFGLADAESDGVGASVAAWVSVAVWVSVTVGCGEFVGADSVCVGSAVLVGSTVLDGEGASVRVSEGRALGTELGSELGNVPLPPQAVRDTTDRLTTAIQARRMGSHPSQPGLGLNQAHGGIPADVTSFDAVAWKAQLHRG